MEKSEKEQITVPLLCNLECVLMPNGEIICDGKSLGFFDKFGKFLTAK